MNLNLTDKFGINIDAAWKEEYKRIGSIYARWGALLVIFLFPLSIIPEISMEKPNLQVWYVFRLGPSIIVGIVFLLHQKYKLSHELLFEIIAFCLFTSAAYMVECGDWLNYIISMVTVFITSAVLVVLRPFYFVINFIAVLIIQVAVNMFFCDMTVADYFLLKGVNVLLVVGIACFSISAFRYYIIKNNFMHRNALQKAHFELQERNQSLLKVQKDLRFKSDQITEQNEELMVQKEEILTQRDAMQSQKEFIEKQNRDIIASIRYAKTIQHAMLPSKESLKKILPHSFVYYNPRDIVSGDFYWLAEINGKTVIAVVDCTGHGVPGGFMSLVGENMLNQIVKQKGITNPAEILNRLHIGINESLQQAENDNQDGMDAAVVVLAKQTGMMEFSGAKNPLLIVNASKEASEIKGDKCSIGGNNQYIKKVEFNNHQIPFEKGSSYYLFSDGFADQFGGERDRKFMTTNFKKLLADISDHTMDDQKFLLEKRFEEWKRGYPQTDDVMVLGFKIE